MKTLTSTPVLSSITSDYWQVVGSTAPELSVQDLTHFSVGTIPDKSGNTFFGQADNLSKFFKGKTYATQQSVVGENFIYVNDTSNFVAGDSLSVLEGVQDGENIYSASATTTDGFVSEYDIVGVAGLIPTVAPKSGDTTSVMLPAHRNTSIANVLKDNRRFQFVPFFGTGSTVSTTITLASPAGTTANNLIDLLELNNTVSGAGIVPGTYITTINTSANTINLSTAPTATITTSTQLFASRSNYVYSPMANPPTPANVANGGIDPIYLSTSGDPSALSNLTTLLPDYSATTFSASTTSGSTTITLTAPTAGLYVGQQVFGIGIPQNTFIQSGVTNASVTNATGTNIVLTNSATATNSLGASLVASGTSALNIYASVNTTLSATASTGATSISLTSTTGVYAGMTFKIGTGETVQVATGWSGSNPVLINGSLASNYASGTAVASTSTAILSGSNTPIFAQGQEVTAVINVTPNTASAQTAPMGWYAGTVITTYVSGSTAYTITDLNQFSHSSNPNALPAGNYTSSGSVSFTSNGIVSSGLNSSFTPSTYMSGYPFIGSLISGGGLVSSVGDNGVVITNVTVTAASGNGTTVTYTAVNNLSAGNVVSISGLGIASGSSLNLSNVTVATASATQFTVTNSTVGVASGTGLVNISPPSYTVTAASGNGTTVTYTSSNSLVAGDTVTITGLGVASGSSLNLSNVIVATATSSQFTVTNTTVGTSSGTGKVTLVSGVRSYTFTGNVQSISIFCSNTTGATTTINTSGGNVFNASFAMAPYLYSSSLYRGAILVVPLQITSYAGNPLAKVTAVGSSTFGGTLASGATAIFNAVNTDLLSAGVFIQDVSSPSVLGPFTLSGSTKVGTGVIYLPSTVSSNIKAGMYVTGNGIPSGATVATGVTTGTAPITLNGGTFAVSTSTVTNTATRSDYLNPDGSYAKITDDGVGGATGLIGAYVISYSSYTATMNRNATLTYGGGAGVSFPEVTMSNGQSFYIDTSAGSPTIHSGNPVYAGGFTHLAFTAYTYTATWQSNVTTYSVTGVSSVAGLPSTYPYTITGTAGAMSGYSFQVTGAPTGTGPYTLPLASTTAVPLSGTTTFQYSDPSYGILLSNSATTTATSTNQTYTFYTGVVSVVGARVNLTNVSVSAGSGTYQVTSINGQNTLYVDDPTAISKYFNVGDIFFTYQSSVFRVIGITDDAIAYISTTGNVPAPQSGTYQGGSLVNAVYPWEFSVSPYSAISSTSAITSGVVTKQQPFSYPHAVNTVVASYQEGNRYFGSSTIGDLETKTPTAIGSIYGSTLNNSILANSSTSLTVATPPLSAFTTSSTSTLTVGLGTQTLTVPTGLPFAVGKPIAIYSSGNISMTGTITSYNSSTGSLVANITASSGSGSPSSWSVSTGLLDISSNPDVSYTNVGFLDLTVGGNVVIVGVGATQEAVTLSGVWNRVDGIIPNNSSEYPDVPVSWNLATGSRFAFDHAVGEPVFIPNMTIGSYNGTISGNNTSAIVTLSINVNTFTVGTAVSGTNIPSGATITSVTYSPLPYVVYLGISDGTSTITDTYNGQNTTLRTGTGFDNSHASGAIILADAEQTTYTTPALIASNQSGTNAVNASLELSMSEPWYIPNGDGSPLIDTSLANTVPAGATIANITNNQNFPTTYPSVYQTNSFRPPEIGRLIGNLPVNSTNIPVNLSGTLPNSLPFFIAMGDDPYLVYSVTNDASGNVNLQISGATNDNHSDLMPIHLEHYDTNGSYTEIAVPYFYLSPIIVSANLTSGSSTITILANRANEITAGMAVSGLGIPAGVLVGIVSGSSVTLVNSSGSPVSIPATITNAYVSFGSGGLTYNTIVSKLDTLPVPFDIPAGTVITLSYGTNQQQVTTTTDTPPGSTTLLVQPFKCLYSYPASVGLNGVFTTVGTVCYVGLSQELPVGQVLLLSQGGVTQSVIVSKDTPALTKSIPVQSFTPNYPYDDNLSPATFNATTTANSNILTIDSGSYSTVNNLLDIGYSVWSNPSTAIYEPSFITQMILGNQAGTSHSVSSGTTSAGSTSIKLNVSGLTGGATSLLAGQYLISSDIANISITAGSPTITVSSATGLSTGMAVIDPTGTYFPPSTLITNIVGNVLTLSTNALISGTQNLLFSAFDNQTTIASVALFSGTVYTVTMSGNPSLVAIPSGTSIYAYGTTSLQITGSAQETHGTAIPFNTYSISLVAPYQFVIDPENNPEIIYPLSIPTVNANGSYLVSFAPATIYNHSAGASFTSHQYPSNPQIGDVIYHPSKNKFEMYTGTAWRMARVNSVQTQFAVKVQQ
jgi:hypothetical protein